MQVLSVNVPVFPAKSAQTRAMKSPRRKPKPSPELRRRINAARELTAPSEEELRQRSVHRNFDEGYGLTVDELGARIDRKGFGNKVLGLVKRGEREVKDFELQWIADACDLPLEFFTVDFGRLPELPEAQPALDGVLDHLKTLERALSQIQDQVKRLGGQGAPGIPGATGRELRDDPPIREGRRRRGKAAEEG